MSVSKLELVTDSSIKESIISIVGFLGSGKTTLLKHLTTSFQTQELNPFIILNDYENANIDAEQFTNLIQSQNIKALSGSCICCSGIHHLRDMVNNIPQRHGGITLIEANGTTDACSLSGFLGVGINQRYLPPIQISVVDCKNWQKRGEHNELEANQIQLSSLIVLNFSNLCSEERVSDVKNQVQRLNPTAIIIFFEELNSEILLSLTPSKNTIESMDHLKSHWASFSIDLPEFQNKENIMKLCELLPSSLSRVKGCVKFNGDDSFTFFERTPDLTINIRPFNGIPTMGSKLLTIGLGSNQELLEGCIAKALN